MIDYGRRSPWLYGEVPVAVFDDGVLTLDSRGGFSLYETRYVEDRCEDVVNTDCVAFQHGAIPTLSHLCVRWKAMPLSDLEGRANKMWKLQQAIATKDGLSMEEKQEAIASVVKAHFVPLHDHICSLWTAEIERRIPPHMLHEDDDEWAEMAESIEALVEGKTETRYCSSCDCYYTEDTSIDYCEECSEDYCESCGPCEDHYCHGCGYHHSTLMESDNQCEDCSDHYCCPGCYEEESKENRREEDDMCFECSDYDDCSECGVAQEKEDMRDGKCDDCDIYADCAECGNEDKKEMMSDGICVDCQEEEE